MNSSSTFLPYVFQFSFEAADTFQIGGFLVAVGAVHFDLPNLAAFVQRTELARKVPAFQTRDGVKRYLWKTWWNDIYLKGSSHRW